MSKTISAGRTPRLTIESVDGDFSLVGWEGDDILLKADADSLEVNQDGDEVKVTCSDDISIRVPKGASLNVVRISGDASIRGVMGAIDLKEIVGDLSMRDVNSVSIDRLESDFSLRGAKGNLSIKQAESDISIRDVEGNVSIESAADDLAIRDVRGNVSANVAEDVVLYLTPQAENNYSVTAGDDILLVMPPKVNVTLTLNADDIDIDWDGLANEDSTKRVITLGDGSANFSLTAGGDIRISNRADAGDAAEEFGNFAGMGMDWSDFGQQISRHVGNVARRATRKAEDAARRIERKVRDAEKRGGKGRVGVNVGRWNWDYSPKGVPMQRKSAASEEEKLTILKMLEEKKITAAEAEQLLAALEGDS